ncbi:nucleotide exchange factor GrpE [Candidatus Woesearchaeota archaeon CG11_big_fil_rev_8_21_14_0_20_43_8]|nr:MAG: nucleotide exchange factor GrpE [Candidatus Woesearchaeota archaeon CG11_big_fil_rev_8_21_14_0_20_43_8]
MKKKKEDDQKKEFEDLKKEKIELIDQLQRLQAEFENYKKRTDKENQRFRECAKKDMVAALLPIVDSFESSLKHKDKPEEYIKGTEMIFTQLSQLLKKEGLSRIECLGKRFNPYEHEVMLVEEGEKEDDLILDEFQSGYKFKDLIIRHAKVKISKKKDDANDNKNDKAERYTERQA